MIVHTTMPERRWIDEFRESTWDVERLCESLENAVDAAHPPGQRLALATFERTEQELAALGAEVQRRTERPELGDLPADWARANVRAACVLTVHRWCLDWLLALAEGVRESRRLELTVEDLDGREGRIRQVQRFLTGAARLAVPESVYDALVPFEWLADALMQRHGRAGDPRVTTFLAARPDLGSAAGGRLELARGVPAAYRRAAYDLFVALDAELERGERLRVVR